MATNPFNAQSVVQTAAQANTPFLANNGNPGTVYNIPQTGGYVPPQSDANNNWAVNPYSNLVLPAPQSQYANNRFWEATGNGGNSNTGGPFFTLPTTGGGGNTPPPWVTPPTGDPPPTTPPTTTPPTGGPTGPVTDYPLHNGPGGTWSPPTGPGTTHINRPSTGGNGQTGASWTGTSLGQWLTTGQGGQLLGMNPDGSISWQQVVDLVSEPWVQGNLYMSNSGQWNPQNVVTALTNTVLPGVGSLFKTLGLKGVFGQQVKNWLIEGREAEAENTMVGMMEELEAWDRQDGTNHTGTNPYADLQLGNSALDPFLSNIVRGNNSLNNVLNGAALDPNWVNSELAQWDQYQNRPSGGGSRRDSRSGRSAGSSTLAEGEAAQDLVNQWQISGWLNGTAAQSRAAMDRMFGGKER